MKVTEIKELTSKEIVERLEIEKENLSLEPETNGFLEGTTEAQFKVFMVVVLKTLHVQIHLYLITVNHLFY